MCISKCGDLSTPVRARHTRPQMEHTCPARPSSFSTRGAAAAAFLRCLAAASSVMRWVSKVVTPVLIACRQASGSCARASQLTGLMLQSLRVRFKSSLYRFMGLPTLYEFRGAILHRISASAVCCHSFSPPVRTSEAFVSEQWPQHWSLLHSFRMLALVR